ncbi:MAG: PRC-barrel domain-containing protein [Limisphaerales bacterium]
MKRAIKFDAKVALATVCVAAAGLLAAQAQDSTATGNGASTGTGSSSITENRNNPGMDQTGTSSSATSDGIMKMNKCSKLIGTDVQNQQGDKLGKIEDVVVDLNNGKVSYCVLEVEHSLFSTPKYLAVPLSAFQPSASGSDLILNADKDKVAQAQGFDRNNWPSPNSPSWGAQPFWQQPSSRSTSGGYNSQYHNSQNNSSSTGAPAPTGR